MPIGWIDFSKSERSKVLSVMELLTKPGAVDELGIGAVRDAFSNRFFPGTSTIQTRAKYFVMVPYIFRDMELADDMVPGTARKILDEKERACGNYIYDYCTDKSGLIGIRSIQNKGWVKRPPSDIYWTGLRQYGIFTIPDMSIGDYLYNMNLIKADRAAIKKLGNRNDDAEEYERDDIDAGDINGYHFWNITTYEPDWFDKLSLKLSKAEAVFLKKQIIETCRGSMLAYILENDMQELVDMESFSDISNIISRFPEEIQEDYRMARDFADLIHDLQMTFDVIMANGKNDELEAEFDVLKQNFVEHAAIDIDSIMDHIGVVDRNGLRRFLHDAQSLMKAGDIEGLKDRISIREVQLKGPGRAKTHHIEEMEYNGGNGYLNYRFGDAKVIISDIFEGEVSEDA